LDRVFVFVFCLLVCFEEEKKNEKAKNYGLKVGLGANVDQGGEDVGEGLAGAGFRDADHVLAQQGHRPSLALNGSGLLESHTGKLIKDKLCKEES